MSKFEFYLKNFLNTIIIMRSWRITNTIVTDFLSSI